MIKCGDVSLPLIQQCYGSLTGRLAGNCFASFIKCLRVNIKLLTLDLSLDKLNKVPENLHVHLSKSGSHTSVLRTAVEVFLHSFS